MTQFSAQPDAQFQARQQPVSTYLRNKVMSATAEELRLMLLDGAIKFANQGLEGIHAKSHEQMYLGISQCRNIVFELLTTIREEGNPELAKQLKSLYTFMYTHLLESSLEKDADKLKRVIEILGYERETWVMLMEKVAAEKMAGKAPVTSAPVANPSNTVPTPGSRMPLSISA